MTVFLLVRRKKTNVFLDASESVDIMTIKQMLTGILGRSPEDQELYYLKESATEGEMAADCDMESSMILLENDKRLIDYSISTSHAKPQSPAMIGLCFRNEDGDFESLDITPYSIPPPLPDIMNPSGKGGNGGANENHVDPVGGKKE